MQETSEPLDLVALGALVVRLDPGTVPFEFASIYQAHISGGEFNVAANAASCFGLSSAIVTASVDYPLGRRVEREVRAMGVRGFYRVFPHDGVRGPNIALVFSDRGAGPRPPQVFYNRADEAAARLKPGDVAWADVFATGARWFHSGGIFASLSSTTPALIAEGMEAARTAGATVSFDLNYRPRLWSAVGGVDRARSVLGELVGQSDVLLGNEEDLQHGLGLDGPTADEPERLEPAAFVALAEQAHLRFPRLRVIATTLRQVRSANRHAWTAVAWIDGTCYQAPTIELDVLDRVGGGDGFASGLIFGLLTGRPPEDAVRLGWAHGALITTFPGDTTMARLADVEALAAGGSARIQR